MTTTKPTHAMTIAEFGHLLDVYGAERTRWPLGARAGAAALLASDRAARRLLAEASAFDTVLSKAPDAQSGETSALADRIMAATKRTPRLVASVQQPARPVSTPAAGWRRHLATERDVVRGVAVLAATLVIGIFVGQTQFVARSVPAIQAFAVDALPGSGDRLALADIHLDAVDED